MREWHVREVSHTKSGGSSGFRLGGFRTEYNLLIKSIKLLFIKKILTSWTGDFIRRVVNDSVMFVYLDVLSTPLAG